MSNKNSVRVTSLFDLRGISAESLSRDTPIKYAKEMKNCFVRNGKICESEVCVDYKLGQYYLTTDKAAYSAFSYRGASGYEYKLIVSRGLATFALSYGRDGFIENKILDSGYTSSVDFRYNGENIVIMVSDKGMYGYNGKETTTYDIGMELIEICNHYSRLFGYGIDSYTIYFSDDLEPFNWNVSADEGGYIYLGIGYGEIKKLISFNQYLYVFCSKGIYRISAYGEQSEFVVKPMDIYTGKVYTESICDGGNKLIYMSDTGINVFDGYTNRVIYPELQSVLKEGKYFNAVYNNNKYYLGYTVGVQTEKKYYVLIIDFTLDIYYIIESKKNYKTLITYFNNDEKICLYNDYVGQPVYKWEIISDEKLCERKTVLSHKLDFGADDKYKIIRSINCSGSTSFRLNIECDNRKYSYKFDKNRNVYPNIKGVNFKFCLSTYDDKIELLSPEIKLEYAENI